MGTPPSSAHTFPMFCQVLPAGLHVLECTLFVGAAAPVRLDFRVDYRLEGTQFPDLNTRQVLGAGAVVAKPGATRCKTTGACHPCCLSPLVPVAAKALPHALG